MIWTIIVTNYPQKPDLLEEITQYQKINWLFIYLRNHLNHSGNNWIYDKFLEIIEPLIFAFHRFFLNLVSLLLINNSWMIFHPFVNTISHFVGTFWIIVAINPELVKIISGSCCSYFFCKPCPQVIARQVDNEAIDWMVLATRRHFCFQVSIINGHLKFKMIMISYFETKSKISNKTMNLYIMYFLSNVIYILYTISIRHKNEKST